VSAPERQAGRNERRTEQRPPGARAPQRPGPTTRDRLLGALSSRAALRRAFVLREALGPPVGLREPPRDRPA
jgi:hypothetical protein